MKSIRRLLKRELGYATGAILMLCLAPPFARVHAQDYTFDSGSGCYKTGAGAVASCTGYPGSASGGVQGPRIGYDPCYLAQNALRPCASDLKQMAKPTGVDSNLVGNWELPLKGGSWVLTIDRGGTYKFHSEARDGTPSHAGTFAASSGHWTMKATNGYTDTGFYLFQAPDIWIATGQLGAAAWRRPSSQKAPRPCTSDQRQPSKSGGVDPNLIGIWKLPLKGGPWVWEILREGAYKFHSEAHDGAPSHSGTFTASNGHWSLKATTGYTDKGLYLFQAPDLWIATGQLGAAAWKAASCDATP